MTQKINKLSDFCNQWDAAMVTNNTAEISSYMSSEWICVGSNGITKADAFLKSIACGDLMHTRMDSDEMHVKIYGNTGIVISRGTSSGVYKGQPFELYEWSTSVFIHDGNTWKCVSTMLTPTQK